LAERQVDAALDKSSFDPARKIHHGTQDSEVRMNNGRPQLVTAGLNGERKEFSIDRVIGVDPLRQFLIAGEGGRWQSTELAFAPEKGEWFDVYGDEDRKPGEWGHWTGRGMTWNQMCAACHNTRVRKNYDARTDSYNTTMSEMTVSCESCHGPMADHNAWQQKNPNAKGDPTIRKLTRDQILSTCGSCHARRAELTGEFVPGENFFDHYHLTIPDDTDVFYPDGQVRDENYELTAFLGSKMHAAGVRCIDCHEPHSSKTRVPGNALCMTCHSGVANIGGVAKYAPRIDTTTHSHHKPNTRGDLCTDCHMPQTTYMQRHGRHDHGFTVPDPQLTRELGIPNACNRCHADRNADWSVIMMEKWYGQQTNEVMRTRARAIARARADDHAAVEPLLKMATGETNFFWRAVAANMLKRWNEEPEVTSVLLSIAGDTNELVRAEAARGLEMTAQSSSAPIQTALAARLNDPMRAVRIDAAWALRRTLDINSLASADLLAYLDHNADQPSGALQKGILHLDRGDTATALMYMQRAVQWDGNSAPLRHALAIAYSTTGRAVEAVTELQAACRLAPREPEYRFKLALALNEVGKLNEARIALEETVKLEPRFAQGWYNLGLAYAAQQKNEAAVEALLRAESLDPRSAQVPYARATVLAKLGRISDARAAAGRALELRPNYADAQALLQSLGR
jgi:predicted CXXCH cytochrome family protein